MSEPGFVDGNRVTASKDVMRSSAAHHISAFTCGSCGMRYENLSPNEWPNVGRIVRPGDCVCGAPAETLGDRIRALQAENDRLRETLEAAAHWHDSERKALGKQPPNTDRDWRRTQHSLQAEEIRASLEVARPTAPATEQEEG